VKIALVNFPILDVGGITTWAECIRIGYERQGHEVTHYYSTSGKNYGCEPDKKTFIGDKYKRGEKVASEFLSYGESRVGKSVKKLSEYDVVHFIHPSPHPVKSQFECNSPLGWLELYKCKAKKIVTMHDVYWAKTNSWFILANYDIDVLVASQQPHYPAVEDYPTPARKMWSYFPMDLKGMKKPTGEKRNKAGMVAHQWIKWKNHHKLLPALAGVDVPIDLFAGGQEYHNMLKDETLKSFVQWNMVEDEKYENEEKVMHTCHGFIAREELIKIYKTELFSIDGSTRGYNNYTHFEPMAYGCISFVHEDVLAGEHNTIPEDCCVSYNWENLKEKIAWTCKNKKEVQKIRANAYKFIKNFKCEVVAEKILDKLEEGGKGGYDTARSAKIAIEAMQKHGWECWGTYDANGSKEDIDYCELCPWWVACASYVADNGIRKLTVVEGGQVEETTKEVSQEVIMGDGKKMQITVDFEDKSIKIKCL